MTEREKKIELARYRLDQAEETLDEARFLLSGGKSCRIVVNRAYYTMFYATLALLIFEPFSSSRHSSIISYFQKTFIKSGMFPGAMGRSLTRAFELRQGGDYKEFFTPQREETELLIGEAESFMAKIREFLASREGL